MLIAKRIDSKDMTREIPNRPSINYQIPKSVSSVCAVTHHVCIQNFLHMPPPLYPEWGPSMIWRTLDQIMLFREPGTAGISSALSFEEKEPPETKKTGEMYVLGLGLESLEGI